MEFSTKHFEQVSKILFSGGQLRKEEKKNPESTEKKCFQNYNLVFLCPHLSFFGSNSTADLHLSPIIQHKQVMRHYSLSQGGY